jgi:uroporphyrinogen-III synthase
LAGRTVLVLRAPQQSAPLCTLLRGYGAEPLPYPATAWKKTEDPEGWAGFTGRIDTGGVCLFTHQAGVGLFLDGLLSRGLDLRTLGRFKIAALGSETEEALLVRGLKADITLRREREARALSSAASPGTSLLMIRGTSEEPFEGEWHRNWGDVLTLTVWREADTPWEPHWNEVVLSAPPDYAVFTTCAEVHGFARIIGRELPRLSFGKPRIVSLNHSVTQTLLGYGLTVNVEPEAPGIEELVQAIIRDAGSLKPAAP